MSTGSKSGWGGKRPGSGRKSIFGITEAQVKAMLKEARKFATFYKKTIDEVLLDIIYDADWVTIPIGREAEIEVPKVDAKTRVVAIKVFKEFSMAKLQERSTFINDRRSPVIGLPEMRPDPAQRPYPKEGNA